MSKDSLAALDSRVSNEMPLHEAILLDVVRSSNSPCGHVRELLAYTYESIRSRGYKIVKDADVEYKRGGTVENVKLPGAPIVDETIN